MKSSVVFLGLAGSVLLPMACGGSDSAELFDGQGVPVMDGGSAGAAGTSAQGGASGVAGQAGNVQAGGGAGEAGHAGAAGAAGSPVACVPVGHDEDLDKVDDACDNCPTYKNPDQANDDGDGVGTVCELPSEQKFLKTIAYFESWMQPPLSEWSLADGFKPGKDLLSARNRSCGYYGQPSCGKNAFWQHGLDGTYSVESVTQARGRGWFGVLTGSDPSSGAWVGCFLHTGASGTPMSPRSALEVWSKSDWNTDPKLIHSQMDVEPSQPGEDVLRRLRVYVNSAEGKLSCSVDNSQGDSAHTPVLEGLGKLSGNPGLRVYRVDADFYSFTVYQ